MRRFVAPILAAAALPFALTGCSSANLKSPETLAKELRSLVLSHRDVRSASVHVDNDLYWLIGDVVLDPAISDDELRSVAKQIDGFDVGSFWQYIEDVQVAQHVARFTHYGPASVEVTIALRSNPHCLSSSGIRELVISVDEPMAVVACFDSALSATENSPYAILGQRLISQTADGRFTIVGSRPDLNDPDAPFGLRPDAALAVWSEVYGRCATTGAMVDSSAGRDAERLTVAVATQSGMLCVQQVAKGQPTFSAIDAFSVTVDSGP